MARTKETKSTKSKTTKSKTTKTKSSSPHKMQGNIIAVFEHHNGEHVKVMGPNEKRTGVVKGYGIVTRIVRTEHEYKSEKKAGETYHRYRAEGKSVKTYMNKKGEETHRKMSWPMGKEKAEELAHKLGKEIVDVQPKEKKTPRKRKTCQERYDECLAKHPKETKRKSPKKKTTKKK